MQNNINKAAPLAILTTSEIGLVHGGMFKKIARETRRVLKQAEDVAQKVPKEAERIAQQTAVVTTALNGAAKAVPDAAHLLVKGATDALDEKCEEKKDGKNTQKPERPFHYMRIRESRTSDR